MPSGPPNPPPDWLENPPPGTIYLQDVKKGQKIAVPARADGSCPGISGIQLPGSSEATYLSEFDLESTANPDESGVCHYTVRKWKERRFPAPPKRSKRGDSKPDSEALR